MLASPSDIADLFSIFHDGEIVSHVLDGRDLRLRIDVEYLAKRIRPTFQCFDVDLIGIADIEFTTWPKQENEPASHLRVPEKIFTPRLEVLSGETEGRLIRVVCNHPGRLSYSGGDLRFPATAAHVRDEAGREWSLEELKSLAEAYWTEFSERGKQNAT